MSQITINPHYPPVDKRKIDEVMEISSRGFLSRAASNVLLDAAGINRSTQIIANTEEQAHMAAISVGWPIAMKAVMDGDKQAVGAIAINVADIGTLKVEFTRIKKVANVTQVSIEPMLSGSELFIKASRQYEGLHTIRCGVVATKKVIAEESTPITPELANKMVSGFDNSINKVIFAEVIRRVSALLSVAPYIISIEISPLISNKRTVTALNARISIDSRD